MFVFINYNNFCRFIDIKVWALNKFIEPKSYLVIIFASIIDKAKQMYL